MPIMHLCALAVWVFAVRCISVGWGRCGCCRVFYLFCFWKRNKYMRVVEFGTLAFLLCLQLAVYDLFLCLGDLCSGEVDCLLSIVEGTSRTRGVDGLCITKTYLYNFDPLKPHFNIVKLGFTGVYIIFLISAQKHRLWVLVRTASPRRF